MVVCLLFWLFKPGYKRRASCCVFVLTYSCTYLDQAGANYGHMQPIKLCKSCEFKESWYEVSFKMSLFHSVFLCLLESFLVRPKRLWGFKLYFVATLLFNFNTYWSSCFLQILLYICSPNEVVHQSTQSICSCSGAHCQVLNLVLWGN